MRITEYFIRRPVAGIVLSLLIFLCGLLCVFFLPVRLHPLVYYPIVTVNTNYPGASAITMENSITTPLELSIASIADISYVQSTSTNGSSVINVHFRLGTNIDKAMLNVMNSTARANKYLPQMSQQPIVSKVDSSLYSLLQLSVISPKTPPLELTRMINRVTLPSLLLLKGVGDVYQQGGAQPEILIRLNPLAMLANKVTVADVTRSL